MDARIFVSGLATSALIFTALGAKGHVKFWFGMAGSAITAVISTLIIGLLGSPDNISLVRLFTVDLLLDGFLISLFIAFMFYRDPERLPEEAEGTIVSPADGIVRYVRRFEAGEVAISDKKGRRFRLVELTQTDITARSGYLIGIGMNLLNVHVNRAPIDGRVVLLNPIHGPFRSLKNEKAIFQNERFTTVISNGEFNIAVVQIASRLVRRIVSYLHEGQTVNLGERIGMIKFGSQVDLIIPDLESLSILVNPGDKVFAGSSKIARFSMVRAGRLENKSDLGVASQ